MKSLSELLISSLQHLADYFTSISSHLIIGLILLLGGWLISKLVSWLFEKFLIILGFNRWAGKTGVQKAMDIAGIHVPLVRVISDIIYWLIFIFFIIAATHALGWEPVTDRVAEIVNYIPTLLSGILLFMAGLLISNFVRNLIKTVLVSSGMQSARLVSRMAYYILLVMISITALNQVGINTSFISNNLTVILATLLLAFGVGFAIASRNILQNILSSTYNRHNFHVGQRINIAGEEGEIIRITNISVIIKTGNSVRIIPAKKFTDETVDVVG
jgi:hypothetical protein